MKVIVQNHQVVYNILKPTDKGFYAEYSQCYKEASLGVYNTMFFEIYFLKDHHNILTDYSYKYTLRGMLEPNEKNANKLKLLDVSKDIRNNDKQIEIVESISRKYNEIVSQLAVKQGYVYLMSGHTSIDNAHMKNIQLSHDRMEFVVEKFLDGNYKDMGTSLPLGHIYPDREKEGDKQYTKHVRGTERQQAVIIVACEINGSDDFETLLSTNP